MSDGWAESLQVGAVFAVAQQGLGSPSLGTSVSGKYSWLTEKTD